MAAIQEADTGTAGGTGSGGSGTGGGSAPAGANANVIQNTFNVSSGLYDVSNTQYPIQFAPGVPNRLYSYTGPLVTLTDKFSGSITLSSAIGAAAPTTATITQSASTLDQWAAAIKAAFGGYVVPFVIKAGTTGYLELLSPSWSIVPSSTTDITLTITALSITDDADANLNFQFIPKITNALGIQSTGTYGWALGIRDMTTGHISNMSPVATVNSMLYPSEANLSYNTTTDYGANNKLVEVYRTANNGSSLLYLGIAGRDLVTGNYFFRDSFNDDFLNPGIVGPINEANDPPPTGLFGMVYHSGRMWGIVGNRVYYSGGPDTTNGSGNEAWPPANYYQFPGNVISIKPTSSGLLVALKDDLHIIRGVDASSFYPDMWLAGFGISNPLAWSYDGQTLYLYTTKQQLHALSPNHPGEEIGFNVGDILAASFPSATTNLTLHRGSSLDYALYVSNGTDTIMRYDPRQKSWAPKSQPLIGAGRVKSLETSTGVNTLLMASPSTHTAAIYKRDLSVWTDNGLPFTAYSTIGTMMVAEPGLVNTFRVVAMQLQNRGSLPTVSILNNELSGSFVRLNNPVADPPDLPPSTTLVARRWYTKSALVPVPEIVNTIQLKVAFPAEPYQNEVLGIYLKKQA